MASEMPPAPVAPVDTPPQKSEEKNVAPQKPPKDKSPSNNPVIAIGVAILLSLLLAGLSFISFLNSDTKKTIDRIQNESLEVSNKTSDIDTTSPLSATDVDGVSQAILDDISSLNDATDFSPNDLTDAALGL